MYRLVLHYILSFNSKVFHFCTTQCVLYVEQSIFTKHLFITDGRQFKAFQVSVGLVPNVTKYFKHFKFPCLHFCDVSRETYCVNLHLLSQFNCLTYGTHMLITRPEYQLWVSFACLNPPEKWCLICQSTFFH